MAFERLVAANAGGMFPIPSLDQMGVWAPPCFPYPNAVQDSAQQRRIKRLHEELQDVRAQAKQLQADNLKRGRPTDTVSRWLSAFFFFFWAGVETLCERRM